MKKPLTPGTKVDMVRMSGWIRDFSGYRHSVTEQRIERWLNQFNYKWVADSLKYILYLVYVLARKMKIYHLEQ